MNKIAINAGHDHLTYKVPRANKLKCVNHIADIKSGSIFAVY